MSAWDQATGSAGAVAEPSRAGAGREGDLVGTVVRIEFNLERGDDPLMQLGADRLAGVRHCPQRAPAIAPEDLTSEAARVRG